MASDTTTCGSLELEKGDGSIMFVDEKCGKSHTKQNNNNFGNRVMEANWL